MGQGGCIKRNKRKKVNKAKAEGESLGIIEALFALIRNRFTSVPRTISQKIKFIRDKEILLNIQKLAIDAKTKKDFVEAFKALNI
jgi:hypothetical protein